LLSQWLLANASAEYLRDPESALSQHRRPFPNIDRRANGRAGATHISAVSFWAFNYISSRFFLFKVLWIRLQKDWRYQVAMALSDQFLLSDRQYAGL
jgi:hypothetical protein